MARFDKTNPINSTFRAHVAVDYPDADLGKVFGCGLDATGKVIKGAGPDGIVGLLIVTEKPGVVGPLRDVSRIDVLVSGEVTDFGPTTGVAGVDFGVAGTAYYSNAAGVISATWAAGSWYVGHTVEPDRLNVQVNRIPAAAAL